MNDKKHIDRLFQEKLRNFEATPSDSVWDHISAELETDKKRKKVIPLWFKITGIAATLLLLISIGNRLFNPAQEHTNSTNIVTTPSTNDQTLPSTKISTEGTSENSELQTPINTTDSHIANVESDNTNEVLTPKEHSKNTSTSASNTIAEITKKQHTTQKNTRTSTYATGIHDTSNNDPVAVNDILKEPQSDTNSQLPETTHTAQLKTHKEITSESAIVDTEVNALKTDIDPSILEQTSDSTQVALETTEDKLSITEELAALEKKKAEEDDTTKDQKSKPENRWQVNPNIAPVYFNSLGEGSSIHSQFNANAKSGDINMSYGIKGSYALNHKLSIRAGVNSVNLGYSTKNIYTYNHITSEPTINPIKNIAFESQNITVISGDNLSFAQIPTTFSNFLEGSLDQKLGYIEVPLELEYKLSQRKIGISVVGGFSTLFLNKNEVYSTLDGNSTYLGKATNVNSTSFSANLGIGLDFKLSERFNFNLEPTFKYQLNTFSETTGNFRPYFVGLYSGLSFKF